MARDHLRYCTDFMSLMTSSLVTIKIINRLFLKTSLVIVFFFFCPLQHYPNLTYDVWGIKYISLNLVRYAV